MKHAITTVLAAMVLLVGLATTAGADNKPVDIPVSRIVLFSSGVGYYEHLGEIDGDATVRLMFKTSQINDVLKSMVVMDLSGEAGAVSINYPSRDPLGRALRSFAVDLSGNPKLADLLKQVRGAEVVVAAPDKMTGTILGVETKTRTINTPGGSTVIREAVLNLVTPKGVQSLPLGTIQSIRLSDDTLRREIDKALALIITSSDKRRKVVEVRFRGKGKRKVRIGYISEAPVWKVSYRLELSGKKPFLQGWAIVENTSEQDWSDVRLSLVSGRPISFIQDLYTPLYMPRPVVRPKLYASLRPREYEEGLDASETKGGLKEQAKRRTGRRYRKYKGVKAEAAPTAAPTKGFAMGTAVAGQYVGARAGGEIQLANSIRSAAAAGKVGELFRFDLTEAIQLPRRRSAMLPIISQTIAAEKISIYNAAVLKNRPLNGAIITNDTGMKMLAGPVTVFDEKMYAGDATIGNLAEKDKRLISYAVDLNVTVDPSERARSRITAAKIVKGVMTLTYMHRYAQTYKIKNKADEERTIIVEHPFHAGRKLLEPKKYEEKTATLYRFRVPVKKESTKEFKVTEEQVRYQTVRIIDRDTRSLLYYSKNALISPEAKAALIKVVEMKQQLASAQRQLAELEKQKKAIEAGQERLRKNIKTVGRDSSYGKRLLKKFSDQEDGIEAMEKDIQKTRKLVEVLRKQLADFINGMNF